MQLGRQQGVNITLAYLGSVDISRELPKGTACPYDAVWPASSLRTLLDPDLSAQYLLQPARTDIAAAIFFNSAPSAPIVAEGNEAGALRNLLGHDIPTYTILFGDADPQQMQKLARTTSGRMFDGRTDILVAFRQAKGYN